jgi:hypothetical protein
MKKTLVSFTISFACFVTFCISANADLLPSWNVTTANPDEWQVARLLQAPAGSYNGYGAKGAAADTVIKNYLESYTTVANPDKTLSEGDPLSYGNVIKNPTYGHNSITIAEAYAGTWYHHDGTPYIAKDIDSPGYYAFQTEFLSPEIQDIAGLFLNIDLDIMADDALSGIFLNGQEITKYSSLKGAAGLTYNAEYGYVANNLELTGSVSLDDLIGQGLFLLDGKNTLEFIVLNAGSVDNPVKFSAVGGIDVGNQRYAQSFNPTPEPATLLICLTCGGLALAIRRRKNKKTE